MARARIAKKQNGPLQHPSGRSYDLEDLHRTSASGWGQSEKAQVDGIGGSTSTSATDDDSGSTIGGAVAGACIGPAFGGDGGREGDATDAKAFAQGVGEALHFMARCQDGKTKTAN